MEELYEDSTECWVRITCHFFVNTGRDMQGEGGNREEVGLDQKSYGNGGYRLRV
jgi:hypothetical protein